MNDQQRAAMIRPRGKSEAPHMIAAYRAMQMALDALEFYQRRCNEQGFYSVNRQQLPVKAITALREALAQPQESPYGKCPICGANGVTRERRICGNDTCANGHSYKSSLSVKSQPQGEWVDLTDDDVEALMYEKAVDIHMTYRDLIRNSAAKFKEKNTPPVVPQIEPVVGAYEVVNESGTEWELVYPAAIHKYKMIPEHRITQTFYTTPPSVEAAIEATKEKAAQICDDKHDYMCSRAAEAIRSMK